ncbi:hypothetical protein Tco_0318811 [Tanacetum coccineum]
MTSITAQQTMLDLELIPKENRLDIGKCNGRIPREVPPKVAIKFKKASLSKKESEIVPGDEEPVKKGKRLKTPAKKSASKPATVSVIISPSCKEKSKRKEKEKVDVAHGKGIELLSKVALSEKTSNKGSKKEKLKGLSQDSS